MKLSSIWKSSSTAHVMILQSVIKNEVKNRVHIIGQDFVIVFQWCVTQYKKLPIKTLRGDGHGHGQAVRKSPKTDRPIKRSHDYDFLKFIFVIKCWIMHYKHFFHGYFRYNLIYIVSFTLRLMRLLHRLSMIWPGTLICLWTWLS